MASQPGARQRQATVQAELDATVARLQVDSEAASGDEPEPEIASAGKSATPSSAALASHPKGFRIGAKVVPPSSFKEIAILGVGTFSRVRMMQYSSAAWCSLRVPQMRFVTI